MRSHRTLLWVLATAIVLIALVLAARSTGLEAGALGPGDYASVIGLSLLAALTGATVMGTFRGRLLDAVQMAIAWLAIFAFLGVIYTYRHDFEAVGRRVLSNLVPGVAVEGVTGPREVTIGRGAGGTYSARVSINGARAAAMIVDTGASTVVLTDADARRAGIRPDALSFSVPVQTANGQALTAAVTLERVEIGPIVERNVRALVARPDALGVSLLGHTFLDRLESFEVRRNTMVLRGKE